MLKLSKLSFFLNDMIILKQIVWESQNWHYNFRGPRPFQIIVQNMQNVLINNSRVIWPNRILMLFLNFFNNFLQDVYQKKKKRESFNSFFYFFILFFFF